MKTMLFVDDRTKRIHAAMKNHGKDFEVTIACNFHEAMRQINEKDFDVISLDCDLGGNDFVDPDSKDSAMEIVRYIQKTGWPETKKRPEYILIHSSNRFARQLLFYSLQEIGFSRIYLERFQYG